MIGPVFDISPNRVLERGQVFIGVHNETLSVVVMRSPIQIVRPLKSTAETKPKLHPVYSFIGRSEWRPASVR
jgi:hypothetical protein